MQPLDFCDLAERLIQNEKNAEGFRSAISRAYYGAFHQAVDFLTRLSIYLVTTNKHEEVYLLLVNSGDASMNQAASALRALRDERNVTDYDLWDQSVEVEVRAQTALDDARDIIAKLNGCRLSTSRMATVTTQLRATVNRLRGLPP